MAVFGDIPKFQFFKDDGTLAVGWQLQTFESGTTTPKATFTDVAGTATNPNPVIMDSRGEASILFDGSYKLVLKDDTGATIWTVDDYVTDTGSSSGSSTDLVPNGSFETDTTLNGNPDSWITSAGDTTARDTSDSIHGLASMKFVSAGVLGGGSIQSENFFEVSAGRDLPISFALKSSLANVENIVEIFWFDENKIATATPSTTILTDATTNPLTWTHKFFKITPVAGAKFAKLKFQGATLSGVAGTTRYDDVIVRGDRNDSPSIKVIDIGDWNMDTTISVNVAHALTLANIRSVKVLIQDDTSATFSVFPKSYSATGTNSSNEEIDIDATNIILRRATGGTFDSVSYDAITFNRGWITIEYI